MKIARTTLRAGSADRAEDVFGYIYAAIVLSSLDEEDDGIMYIAGQLRSGMWAEYSAKYGNQEIIRELLDLDEQSFLEDNSIYILSKESKKKIFNLISGDRLMSAQKSAQQVMDGLI
jgi:hypothetical protein